MSSKMFKDAVLGYWAELVRANETGSRRHETLAFVKWVVNSFPNGIPLVHLYDVIPAIFKILLQERKTTTNGALQDIKEAVEKLLQDHIITARAENINIDGAQPFKGPVLYPNNVKD